MEFEQTSFERAFLDSHALLSVPGQTQASQSRSMTGDLTSDAMIDSLEQILGDIGDGVMDGFEVEETELRDWENTLVNVNHKREDVSVEMDRILANDVFSYVEEALRRETAGIQTPDQKPVNTLTHQGPLPGSVFSNNIQAMVDRTSGFADQTLLGPKGASQIGSNRAALSQCRNTPQEHTSSLWPNNQQCGNQMISTQSFQPDVTQDSWLPSVQNNIHQSSGAEVTNQRGQYRLNHVSSQQAYVGQPLQSPSAWQQQQQLPQHFPHHTLTHSSHTPGSANPTAQSFHPQTQRLSGSCMYEKREGHIPNAAANAAAVPPRQNGPLLGPARSKGATENSHFSLSHPCVAVGVLNQGMVHPSGPNVSFNADVGDLSLGAAQSEYPNGNGSLQSSFFCWNREAQVKLKL